MVELRKRKAAAPAPPVPAKKKATTSSKKAAKDKPADAAPDKVEDSVAESKVEESKAEEKGAKAPNGKVSASAAPAVGDAIDFEGFGGVVETHDGSKVTLKELVEKSEAGVVLFTYPKANTPGCTTQACAFRDGHETLTSSGLTIFGLSSDSPKSNTTFKTKQSLPFTMLCNPSYSLIGAIGMQGGPGKTKRGVFAVDKSGKVLLAFTGGPIPTVDAVKKLVDSMKT